MDSRTYDPKLLFSYKEPLSFDKEKKDTIKAARELLYPAEAIKRLQEANTSSELTNIMKSTREGKYGPT